MADSKAAAEALGKLAELLAPEPAAGDPPAPPAAPVDEVYGAIGSADVSASAQGVMKAVERYRNAMRWMIGAVAAVGLALFGSVAFTEGDPGAWQWVGLIVAAAGLAAMLWAATMVFEPEDASLGELARSFEEVGQPGLFSFRRQATARLKTIIDEEKTAHLGPDVANVRALIHQIGELEADRRDDAREVQASRRALADAVERRAAAEATLAALVAARKVVEEADVKAGLDDDIRQAATALAEAGPDVDSARDDLADDLEALAVHDVPLGGHVLRRSVLLDESGVSQVRGTFRGSRPLLLLGAALALAGTIVYLSDVKGDDDDATPASAVRIGTLQVAPGSEAAELFEEDCTDVALDVTHFGADRPADDDAFEIVVVRPSRCAGTYAIPEGSGDAIALQLSRPVDVPDEPDADEPEADEGASGG